MVWEENVPRGDLLPLNERPRFQGNWQYIRTHLRDDHYWDEEGDHDGHHKIAAMTNLADTGVPITGVEPTDLPLSTEGMFYVRPKTATESTVGQQSEPFYMMNDGTNNIISQLGFKALVVFNGQDSSGDLVQTDVIYFHNVALQSDPTAGVTRNSSGDYTITFATTLSSDQYLCLLGALNGNDNVIHWTRTASTTSVRVRFTSRGGTNINPTRCYVAIIGG